MFRPGAVIITPLCETSNVKKLRTSLGSLFIVELATCFDPARSSLRVYVNQVRLKNCVHQWDPKDVRSFLTLLDSHKGLMMTLQGRNVYPILQ
jgi:hypothetical protein